MLELDENCSITYFDHREVMVKNSSAQSEEMRCIDETLESRGEDERFYSLYHHETEGYMTIEVIDSGIGITEDGK